MSLIKKGIVPYEYLDSLGRFGETSLPSIESFYSNLYVEVFLKNIINLPKKSVKKEM